MNIERVKELNKGQEFNNKATLYRAIGIEPAKGKRNRKYQDREIARSLEFELIEEGKRKVRVTKIHDTLQPKIDLRGSNGNNYKDTPSMLVDVSNYSSTGVYKITLGIYIYIGSTADSFRTRYLDHTYDTNTLSTKQMLEDGGVFEILELCDGVSEPEIRVKENKWIEKYKADNNFNVVNQRETWSYSEKIQPKPKIKHKSIKVMDTEYDSAVGLLEDYGYNLSI